MPDCIIKKRKTEFLHEMDFLFQNIISIKMQEPVGATPCVEKHQGEFSEYWSLNYAKAIVFMAKKVVESELYNLQPIKNSEKIAYMETFRKDLSKALLSHYKK